MPIDQIIALLTGERDRLTRALEALQGPTKRRGRPPKSAPSAAAPEKKRRRRTAAQRKAQAQRMRDFWAKKRKEDAKKG